MKEEQIDFLRHFCSRSRRTELTVVNPAVAVKCQPSIVTVRSP
jgi:hypothetical protein